MARVVGMASAGVAPRIMGIGPVPATRKLMDRTGLTLDQMDVIELNEAFAARRWPCCALGPGRRRAACEPQWRRHRLGHPLGMSGARLVLTAALQLRRVGGRYALVHMCVGVGQGTALILERI
jgi:acetyl-CoA acyltransferase